MEKIIFYNTSLGDYPSPFIHQTYDYNIDETAKTGFIDFNGYYNTNRISLPLKYRLERADNNGIFCYDIEIYSHEKTDKPENLYDGPANISVFPVNRQKIAFRILKSHGKINGSLNNPLQ